MGPVLSSPECFENEKRKCILFEIKPEIVAKITDKSTYQSIYDNRNRESTTRKRLEMIKNLFSDPKLTTRKLDVFESARSGEFEKEFNPDWYYSDLCIGFKEGECILPVVYYNKETSYYLTFSRVFELAMKKRFAENFKFPPEYIICNLHEMTIL
jgi:hypothetical protein